MFILSIVFKDAETFVRTIYAGNAVMTLKSKDAIKILTIRTTAFEADESSGGSAATETSAAIDTPNLSQFIGSNVLASREHSHNVFQSAGQRGP